MFPIEFVERIKSFYPLTFDDLLTSLEKDSTTSIRLNQSKSKLSEDKESILWLKNGYFIKDRPIFTTCPLFQAGAYYVQEASSMFLDFILKKIDTSTKVKKALDLCAAPGGKSTIILDNLNNNSFLMANEIAEKRNLVLRENLNKWGKSNFIVTQNKVQDFKPIKNYFDLIVLDAPCSGEGLFRKDKKAISQWSIQNTETCVKRQLELITDIWGSLANEGYLIYSTCTFNKNENEYLLDEFQKLNNNFNSVYFPIVWEEISVSQYNNINFYQFLPQNTRGEGFFISILQKKEKDEYKLNSSSSFLKSNFSILPDFIAKDASEYLTIYKNDKFDSLVSKSILNNLSTFKKHLYIKQLGIEILQNKGSFQIPTFWLALSINIDTTKFNSFEVSKYQALQYFSKEIFDTSHMPNGIILLTYKKLPIGFIKNFGQRHNNLLPSNYRILMDWKSKFSINDIIEF